MMENLKSYLKHKPFIALLLSALLAVSFFLIPFSSAETLLASESFSAVKVFSGLIGQLASLFDYIPFGDIIAHHFYILLVFLWLAVLIAMPVLSLIFAIADYRRGEVKRALFFGGFFSILLLAGIILIKIFMPAEGLVITYATGKATLSIGFAIEYLRIGAYLAMAASAAMFILYLLWARGKAPQRPDAAGATPAPGRAKATIVGLEGMYKDASFDVSDGKEVVLGRDNSCNIVFDQYSAGVSRKHCSIRYNAATDSYTVTDLSKNGTYSGDGKLFLPNQPENVVKGTKIYFGTKKNLFILM